jgi:hypothetical protein
VIVGIGVGIGEIVREGTAGIEIVGDIVREGIGDFVFTGVLVGALFPGQPKVSNP